MTYAAFPEDKWIDLDEENPFGPISVPLGSEFNLLVHYIDQNGAMQVMRLQYTQPLRTLEPPIELARRIETGLLSMGYEVVSASMELIGCSALELPGRVSAHVIPFPPKRPS